MKKKVDQETGEISFQEFQCFVSGKQIRDGVEYPETTPVELPIGYHHPPSITEMLQQMVRQELQMREEMGEDVDEAEREEDFSLDEDEEELLTPFEAHYMAAQEKEALVRASAAARRSKKGVGRGDGAKPHISQESREEVKQEEDKGPSPLAKQQGSGEKVPGGKDGQV